MVKYRRIQAICVFVFCVLAVSAQKTKKVEGEYIYHAPENVSMAEAKRIAQERAMNAALANEFGTLVSQSNSTVAANRNGESSIDFVSLGGSEVKGEWLRTIGEPEFETVYEQGMLVVSCRVKGEAREITSVPIALDIKVLRNGTDPKRHESLYFKNEDDVFLYFQTPDNGYLAVFLLDETTTDVSCLLPYQDSGLSSVNVLRGKQYVFFSDQTCDPEEREYVESYMLLCNKEMEYNTLYVVFSPNRFAAPITDKAYLDVKTLTYRDFNKWLTSQRVHDKDMNVRAFNLRIEK